MKVSSSNSCLYVPNLCLSLHLQHYSFYDLIVTKARGKSGPLFHFDVHDDIRLVNDARVEKDEVGCDSKKTQRCELMVKKCV